MKTKFNLSLLGMIILLTSLSSCLKDDCEREVTYIQSTPIYKTKTEIRLGEPITEAPRDLLDPVQFYYYKEHIFISERGQGIHIIDNTHPENPQPVSFLSIEGAENMAIKNDILYVNNYVDLLTIDVSNPKSTSLMGRTNDIFEPIWEDVNNGDVILVGYDLEEVTEMMDCDGFKGLRNRGGLFFTDEAFALSADVGSSISNGPVGVGGSMARFTIIGDFLYAVSNTALDVVSLEAPTNPTYVNTVDLGWGIETIFPYGDKLFIGSNSGMFIFDNADPAAPTQLSVFQHARACDPVFVKDEYAYVTLRSGNMCDGFINQLDLIDISDLTNPKLIESFPMHNPHGLTIRNDHLILCEGDRGIKAFDISEPEILDEKLLDEYQGLHAFDAISLPGEAPITVIIGEDGFYQFMFNEAQGFELLSQIETKK
jgi:hypothetical protein